VDAQLLRRETRAGADVLEYRTPLCGRVFHYLVEKMRECVAIVFERIGSTPRCLEARQFLTATIADIAARTY
jgi:hypothetical protein